MNSWRQIDETRQIKSRFVQERYILLHVKEVYKNDM